MDERQSTQQFTVEMAHHLNAGASILQALRRTQYQPELASSKGLLARITRAVESGATLSEALGLYPDLFSEEYVAVIQEGEQANDILPAFSRLLARSFS